MNEITLERERRVQRWIDARKEKETAIMTLNRAQTELSNAEINLMQGLVPSDFTVGEKFCIAYGNDFIQLEILPNNNCTIKIRPKSK